MTFDRSTSVSLDIQEAHQRDIRFRIEMTVGCRDADTVPKVHNAGQIFFDGQQQVQVLHNGVRVVAGGYYGTEMAEIIQRLHGHHEPQEEKVFSKIVNLMPETSTMIELGCFWAYYSLWLLQARPQARAIGVEPDLANLDVGRRNAALNGREMTFIEASVGGSPHDPRPFQTEVSGVRQVPQVSVPQLMAALDIECLDILHCDTQGAETEILMSCRELFVRGKIRFCVISTHHHYISGDPLTHQRCLGIIRDLGGQVLAEHNVAESFSGDGLIAAYFGKEPISFPKINLSYNRTSTNLFRDPLFDLAESWAK